MIYHGLSLNVTMVCLNAYELICKFDPCERALIMKKVLR